MAPVVEAYQAMRGASFLVGVTFAAEIRTSRLAVRWRRGGERRLLMANRFSRALSPIVQSTSAISSSRYQP